MKTRPTIASSWSAVRSDISRRGGEAPSASGANELVRLRHDLRGEPSGVPAPAAGEKEAARASVCFDGLPGERGAGERGEGARFGEDGRFGDAAGAASPLLAEEGEAGRFGEAGRCLSLVGPLAR